MLAAIADRDDRFGNNGLPRLQWEGLPRRQRMPADKSYGHRSSLESTNGRLVFHWSSSYPSGRDIALRPGRSAFEPVGPAVGPGIAGALPAACLGQAVMINDILAPKSGYHSSISYVLDDGNRYKQDIRDVDAVLRCHGVNIRKVGFEVDDSNSALQAADMVSWTVRKLLSGKLPSGFEPLSDLFDQHHTEVPYEEEWMQSVADKLRDSDVPK
jgi:hypothetical protein